MSIRYTGFADEAAAGIMGQIEATKRLGWTSIESRNIDGVNITDIDDATFDRVEAALKDSGVRIDCFGSAVANWSKDPRKEEDFNRSVEELKRAIPRMQRLGTKMIRGMSFAVVRDEEPDSPHIQKMVIEKVNVLVQMCEEAGILYLHENCMNFGGLSWEHSLRLVDGIKSPAFALVFDTGNPPFTFDRRNSYQLQSSWEFYSNVKPFIKHIHIKDAEYIGPSGGIFPKAKFTFPGEGHGDVVRIIEDVVNSGWSGFLSIEPHMEIVHHEGDAVSSEEVKAATYVKYGKRLMELVAAAQAK
ncbi:hypothetical protein MASR2M78_29340 [Treponema sp.]